MSLRLKSPRPDAAAEQGESLGAHLLRRRRELRLRRIDVAAILDVDPKTLMWWERDERLPYVHAYPSLIAFLGYEPWGEPATLGAALLAERRRQGASVERAALALNVDPGTWLRWESGSWRPTRLTLPLIDGFLGLDVRESFPRDVR